jgi:hypothetical protein
MWTAVLSYAVMIPPSLTIALPNDAFTFQVDWDGVVGKLLGFGIMVLELFGQPLLDRLLVFAHI